MKPKGSSLSLCKNLVWFWFFQLFSCDSWWVSWEISFKNWEVGISKKWFCFFDTSTSCWRQKLCFVMQTPNTPKETRPAFYASQEKHVDWVKIIPWPTQRTTWAAMWKWKKTTFCQSISTGSRKLGYALYFGWSPTFEECERVWSLDLKPCTLLIECSPKFPVKENDYDCFGPARHNNWSSGDIEIYCSIFHVYERGCEAIHTLCWMWQTKVEIQTRGVGADAITHMKSATDEDLKNWRDKLLIMFPLPQILSLDLFYR